jgi:predicted CXXCH cytochrome family protein
MPDDLAEIKAKSRTSLTAVGWSKRRPAWTLAIVVALAFFALPTILALIPPLRHEVARLPMTPDQSWNPGELSAGHQRLSRDCGVCHEIPFVRVRDRVCIECHDKTPGHLQTVAAQQQLFGGTRCASCHADHKGKAAPVRRDPGLCTACHADLKRKLPETTLTDATDFKLDHPEFKLTLWQGPGKDDVMRIPQSDKARLFQRSNLKFPHDVHLKTSLRGPKGRTTLTCASCHVPDASRKGFDPIVMKRVCVECHTLEFEPAVTTRQVPHGSVDDVLLTMQEFYANIALNNIPVDVVDLGEIRRGLPRLAGGEMSEEQRQRALTWAKSKAQATAADLFEARVCIVCHEVGRTVIPGETGAQTSWTVAPVHIVTAWLPKARFNHSKHSTGNFKCADCHDVEKSHSSADIAMPTIATCRNCHGGNEPSGNKIASTCVTCHGFHLPGHPPFGARADASSWQDLAVVTAHRGSLQ